MLKNEIRQITAKLIDNNLRKEMYKIGLKMEESKKMGKFVVIESEVDELENDLNKLVGDYRIVSTAYNKNGWQDGAITVILQQRPPVKKVLESVDEIGDAFEAAATFLEDNPEAWEGSVVDDPWHAANKLRKIAREYTR